MEGHTVMHRSILLTLLAAAFLAALVPATASAQTYTLTDLGALASGPTTAADISPAGVVTGGLTVMSGTGTAAALWTPGSGGYTFQNAGFPNGAAYSPAYGVNDTAQLAVTAAGSGGSWENGFLWSGGRWTDLTSRTKQSEATAINASGLLVGTAADSKGNFQATLWKAGKQYTIPTTGGSRFAPVALGINDSGQVAGYEGNLTPFVWTPNSPNGTSGSTLSLNVAGGRALGINSLGDVAGDIESNYPYQAFSWSHSTGVVTYLPFLPGAASATARRVNTNGQVVGNATFPDGSTHGILWQNGQVFDLNSLTITGGIPAGWIFACPYTQTALALNLPLISINDAGQICGTASVTVNGIITNHAFLLTPQ
jgi:probable HAF family extracellular repeat protein